MSVLMDERTQTIRPTIPGGILELTGKPTDRPGEMVFMALMRDEATYRALANDSRQDAWYRRMIQLVERDTRWEDIEMEITLQD